VVNGGEARGTGRCRDDRDLAYLDPTRDGVELQNHVVGPDQELSSLDQQPHGPVSGSLGDDRLEPGRASRDPPGSSVTQARTTVTQPIRRDISTLLGAARMPAKVDGGHALREGVAA
jgi:hypothetical protein